MESFSALRRSYPKEISALQNADIRDWRTFEQLDVDALADQIGLQAERLKAFRLHAEMNTTSPIFDVAAATMLVRMGVRSRRDLASREPHELHREVAQALKAGSIGSEGFQREYVGNWVYLARGWDLYKIYHVHDPAWIRRSEELIWSVLIPHNPNLDPLKFIEPSYWATLKTIAHMRAILTSAGVHDLSALAPFKIRRRTRIRPGYHFQPGSRQVALLDDAFLRELLVTQGGAFSKVKAVNVVDYGLHIVPNPVTQAVILGPLISFVDDGAQIIIGRDVTELIIVTETIDYDLVNKIVYEDDDVTPPQPAPFAGPPDLPRFPANLTSAYTPGSTNRKGRDGLRGIDGMAGSDGFANVEDAPLLKLYVKSTPAGLPDIRLNGRPGGIGGDGQDGGPGEDGAKGRESVGSVWVFERGLGGQGGNTGAAGRGGEAGHDTSGCDAHPEWHGADGRPGTRGAAGGPGLAGQDGSFTSVPITVDQWQAAFTYPYLLRLEPTSGPPGTVVTVVGVNISKYATHFVRARAGTGCGDLRRHEEYGESSSSRARRSAARKRVCWRRNTTGASVPGLSDTMSNALSFRAHSCSSRASSLTARSAWSKHYRLRKRVFCRFSVITDFVRHQSPATGSVSNHRLNADIHAAVSREHWAARRSDRGPRAKSRWWHFQCDHIHVKSDIQHQNEGVPRISKRRVGRRGRNRFVWNGSQDFRDPRHPRQR